MEYQMSVHIPFSLEGYELCHPVEQADFETIILQINGVPRASNWRPIAMEIIHEDEGQKLLESDSPWLGAHALILRPSATAAMMPLLGEGDELLPLFCPETDLSMFNPTRVLDALDEDASSVLRFSDGQLMRVNRYSFRPDVIGDTQIFKIPNLRSSPTFVSERFVRTWKSAGLRGLGFKKVWSP
jgi:hypothetical protein